MDRPKLQTDETDRTTMALQTVLQEPARKSEEEEVIVENSYAAERTHVQQQRTSADELDHTRTA